MKKLAGAIVVLGCMTAAPAFAADVGLGVSVRSNDTSIYVPVWINDGFLIEPFGRQLHQKLEIEEISQSLSSDTLVLGVGGFFVRPIAESFRYYFGARLAYLEQEADSVVFNIFSQVVETQKSDGYRVAPVLGVEYAFNEHLSIAGEAEYFYQEVNGDGDVSDQSANGTETRLVVRFRF